MVNAHFLTTDSCTPGEVFPVATQGGENLVSVKETATNAPVFAGVLGSYPNTYATFNTQQGVAYTVSVKRATSAGYSSAYNDRLQACVTPVSFSYTGVCGQDNPTFRVSQDPACHCVPRQDYTLTVYYYRADGSDFYVPDVTRQDEFQAGTVNCTPLSVSAAMRYYGNSYCGFWVSDPWHYPPADDTATYGPSPDPTQCPDGGADYGPSATYRTARTVWAPGCPGFGSSGFSTQDYVYQTDSDANQTVTWDPAHPYTFTPSGPHNTNPEHASCFATNSPVFSKHLTCSDPGCNPVFRNGALCNFNFPNLRYAPVAATDYTVYRQVVS